VFAAHLRDRRETGQTIGHDAAVRCQTTLRQSVSSCLRNPAT
jgi:hypothetical protein